MVGIGLVLSALGFVLILFSSNLLTASIYLSVFAAGNALIRPCVTSLITQKTPVGQGVASGLSSSMDSLGRISGPLLGAGIYDYSNTLPFLTGALLSVGALYLLYRFIVLDRNGTRHPPNRFNRPNKPPHRMFRSGGLFFAYGVVKRIRCKSAMKYIKRRGEHRQIVGKARFFRGLCLYILNIFQTCNARR